MKKYQCADCGNDLDEENSGYYAEGFKGDVCEECYRNIVNTCQLCQRDDLMPSQVSGFILVKNELSPSKRPPGIYRIRRYPFLLCPMIGSTSMFSDSVIFTDRLPRPDRTFEISGHICKPCAAPYNAKFRAAYGHAKCQYKRPSWKQEHKHIRNTLLENPIVLRDLECGEDQFDWEEMREIFQLPNVQTYHHWLVLAYKGVRVYSVYSFPDRGDNWLTLRPEPKYRNGYSRDELRFCASELPTWPKRADDDRVDEYSRQYAIPTLKRAIDKGFLTQTAITKAKTP